MDAIIIEIARNRERNDRNRRDEKKEMNDRKGRDRGNN